MWRPFLFNYLEALSPLVVVLAFVPCLWRGWPLPPFMRTLFAYFVCCAIIQGVAAYIASLGKNNIVWYTLNGFITLILLSRFFYQILQRPLYKRLVVYGVLSGVGLYMVFLFLYHDGISFFSPGYSIGSLLIIIYCLLFLIEAFNVDHPLIKHGGMVIWIVSGLLNYFLGAYAIHITYRVVTRHVVEKGANHPVLTPSLLWGIHNSIYFISCVFIAVQVLRMLRLLRTDHQQATESMT